MLNINKISTYAGFAIKSGKVVFGYDNLITSKKNIKLVLICSSINDKMYNKIQGYCDGKHIKYYKFDNEILSDIIHRDNCKMLGITDESLSKAIKNELKMEN